MARFIGALAMVGAIAFLAGPASRYEFVMPPFIVTASQDVGLEAPPLSMPGGRSAANEMVCTADACNSSALCDAAW